MTTDILNHFFQGRYRAQYLGLACLAFSQLRGEYSVVFPLNWHTTRVG